MKSKFKHAGSLILIALACAGCASIGQVDKAAAIGPGDAYFVIGVDPEFTRIQVDDGALEEGKFQTSLSARLWGGSAVFMGEPEDGFILGKAHGDALLAITMVQPHASKTAWLGPLLTPCQTTRDYAYRPGSKTLVFKAKAGTVLYVINVHYSWVRDGMVPSYHSDMEGARKFLKAHYPQFADALVQGEYEEKVAGLCGWS